MLKDLKKVVKMSEKLMCLLKFCDCPIKLKVKKKDQIIVFVTTECLS